MWLYSVRNFARVIFSAFYHRPQRPYWPPLGGLHCPKLVDFSDWKFDAIGHVPLLLLFLFSSHCLIPCVCICQLRPSLIPRPALTRTLTQVDSFTPQAAAMLSPMDRWGKILLLSRAILRIHDILVWIRIRGFMPLTIGSGSCCFRH